MLSDAMTPAPNDSITCLLIFNNLMVVVCLHFDFECIKESEADASPRLLGCDQDSMVQLFVSRKGYHSCHGPDFYHLSPFHAAMEIMTSRMIINLYKVAKDPIPVPSSTEKTYVDSQFGGGPVFLHTEDSGTLE